MMQVSLFPLNLLVLASWSLRCFVIFVYELCINRWERRIKSKG